MTKSDITETQSETIEEEAPAEAPETSAEQQAPAEAPETSAEQQTPAEAPETSAEQQTLAEAAEPSTEEQAPEPTAPHHITVIGFDLLAIETAKVAAAEGFTVTLFRPLFPEEGKHIYPLTHGKCIEKGLNAIKTNSGIEIIEAPSITSLQGLPGDFKLTFIKDGTEQNIETDAILIEPLTGEVPVKFFPEIYCSGNEKVISLPGIELVTAHTNTWEDKSDKSILYVTEGGSSTSPSNCNCYNKRSYTEFADDVISFAKDNEDIKITILCHKNADLASFADAQCETNQKISLIEGTLAKIIPQKNSLLALCFDKATSRPLRIEADLVVVDMIAGPAFPNHLISETVDFTDSTNLSPDKQRGIYFLDPYKTNGSASKSFRAIAHDSLNKINEFLLKEQQ